MPDQLKVITDTQTEVHEVADVKNYLRQFYTAGVDTDLINEDELITLLQKSSREACENFARMTIMPKTYDFWTDEIPPDQEIHLPRGPNSSITGVWKQDREETETELVLNTGYYKRGLSDYILTLNTVWNIPIVTSRNTDLVNPIRIRFVAGYTDASEVPSVIKDAIYQTCSFNYENLREISEGKMSATLPVGARALMKYHRRWVL